MDKQHAQKSTRINTIERQREDLVESLKQLQYRINQAPGSGSMKQAAKTFHDSVADCMENSTGVHQQRTAILNACDVLRYVHYRCIVIGQRSFLR